MRGLFLRARILSAVCCGVLWCAENSEGHRLKDRHSWQLLNWPGYKKIPVIAGIFE